MGYDDKGIRSYGPGKYVKVIDKYVHDLSLDGAADELGDVETFNFYSKVTLGPEAFSELVKIVEEDNHRVTPEEKALIRKSAGAILEQTNQGFVYVEYFRTKKSLEARWKKIEKEWAKFDDGGGD